MCNLNWNQICGVCSRRWQQCRTDTRFRQESLIIVLGLTYAILFFVHLSGNNLWILTWTIGILFVGVEAYYILFQTRWKIVRHYFWWQFRPMLIFLCGCGIVVTNTIDVSQSIDGWTYWSLCDTGVYFCAVLLFITMDTMPRESVSQILYILYPLMLIIVTGLDFCLSYLAKHTSVNVESFTTMDTGQFERLCLSQIFLYCVITFVKAIRNPSRLYFSLLVKPVGRRQWVHESQRYEKMRRFTVTVALFWILMACVVLIFSLSTLDTSYSILDIVIVILLFLLTFLLIFIEFDFKVLFKLLFHYRSFLIIATLITQMIAQLISILSLNSTNTKAMLVTNVLFWSFSCFYMILVDGMRNIPSWYRLFFYGIIVIKGFCEILGTWIKPLNHTLYPNTSDYYKHHESYGYAVSEVVRISWVVLVGVALVAVIETSIDPRHDNFIMFIKSLSRKDVDTHLHYLSLPDRKQSIKSHNEARRNSTNNRNYSAREIAYGAAFIDQRYYTTGTTHNVAVPHHHHPSIMYHSRTGTTHTTTSATGTPSGSGVTINSTNSNTRHSCENDGDIDHDHDVVSNEDQSVLSAISSQYAIKQGFIQHPGQRHGSHSSSISGGRKIYSHGRPASPHTSLLGQSGSVPTRKMSSGQRSVLEMPL